MDSLFLSLKFACANATKLASASAQARTGLHGAQAPALFMLSIRGSCRIGELAEDLELGKPATTTLVARMEKAKLISRKADQDDARASLIELTKRGRGIADEIAAMIAGFDKTLVDGFSGPERAVIQRFLGRISQLETL